MDNEEFQILLEKHHITPIINYLKIGWEDVEIGNRPDVVIRNYEGKLIGIENTEYHPTRKIQETEAKLDKICKDYAKILRERGDIGYQLNIQFSDYVYSLKRIDSKKVIEEIDNCRKHEFCGIYIYGVDRFGVIKDDVVVGRTDAFIIDDKIDYSEIQRCIDRKEKKLIEYKKLEKNQSIDEYWLNINIPLTEKVVYKQEDTYNVESGYKRIYLSTYELGDKPLRIK